MSALRQALEYADRGLPLLPIEPRGKRPNFGALTDTYGHAATTDLRQRVAERSEVEQWFASDPEANVGIWTGVLSGLVVLDYDRPAPLPELPATPIATTGRGTHVYLHTATPVRSATFAYGDIRGEGGYVVAPTSVHESGQRYEWLVGLDEADPVSIESISLPLFHLPEGGGEQLHVVAPFGGAPRYELQQFDQDEVAVAQMCHTLGIPPVGVGKSFCCVLPGHQEATPSASLFREPRKGSIVYHDFHRADGKPFYTLTEVYAARRTGIVLPLRGAEHAVWNLRLLEAAGVLTRNPVPARRLASRIKPPSVHAVYNGFVRLAELVGTPCPFTWRFAALWCGVGETTAGKAIHELLRMGYLEIVRRAKPALFALGDPVAAPRRRP